MCACIIMQVKMKPELALIQFAVFNHWAVTLINYQATEQNRTEQNITLLDDKHLRPHAGGIRENNNINRCN